MAAEATGHKPAHDPIQDALLALLADRKSGRLDAEPFLERVEDLVGSLPLYPPSRVMGLGAAAGEVLDKNPETAIEVVLLIMGSTIREVRALAAAMLHRLARLQPSFWADTVKHLATDDDWEVRDIAAHAYDTIEGDVGAVEFHYEWVSEAVGGWALEDNYLLRRAASQALSGYALQHADFRPQLLDLLDPLFDDDLEYVRQNYAATLRKLGRADPELVMDYLESKAAALTDPARDTIRTVLQHHFANRLPERKAKLLSQL
jgi:hypothetical protein